MTTRIRLKVMLRDRSNRRDWRSRILLHSFVSALKSMERVKGIEPSSQAWEARILPLNHTRNGFLVSDGLAARNCSICRILANNRG